MTLCPLTFLKEDAGYSEVGRQMHPVPFLCPWGSLQQGFPGLLGGADFLAVEWSGRLCPVLFLGQML